jgi:ABC-type phosphate transport system permease subunit
MNPVRIPDVNDKPQEPKWRQTLCWFAVIAFFSVPLSLFLLQTMSLIFPAWQDFSKEHLQEYRWMGDWMRTLAALVFGLAGLNSVDRWRGDGGKKDA